jgi:hypothetical protein
LLLHSNCKQIFRRIKISCLSSQSNHNFVFVVKQKSDYQKDSTFFSIKVTNGVN